MKIETINRKVAQKLGDEISKALQSTAEKFGVDIKLGRCTFAANNCRFIIEVATLNESGIAETREREDFRTYAHVYGFAPDDLGKLFPFQNETYTIIGLKPQSRKFPILGRNGKKVFKFMPSTVLKALGRKVPENSPMFDG